MNEKRILVLFTCYNRSKITERAILKLSKQYKNISFLVVDDNSTDDTVEKIKKLKDIDIKVINTKGNKYYSASMRIGMEYLINNNLKYDYLLLINDDVDFEDNFLNDMVSFSNNYNDSIIVGATHDKNNKLSYGGYLFNSKIKYSINKVGPEYENYCDTCNGNCVLIPYSIFLDVGPYDKRYTHYIGDTDYGFMVRKKGYKIKMYNHYVGMCNTNTKKGTWLDNTLSIKERLRLKKQPKGYRSSEYLHYYCKNFNIIMGLREIIIAYLIIFLKK